MRQPSPYSEKALRHPGRTGQEDAKDRQRFDSAILMAGLIFVAYSLGLVVLGLYLGKW